MDDVAPNVSGAQAVSPEALSAATFTRGFRGYRPAEVSTYLREVSEYLTEVIERETVLRNQLSKLRAEREPPIDEEVLLAALGDRAARTLTDAQQEAASTVGAAQFKASSICADASICADTMAADGGGSDTDALSGREGDRAEIHRRAHDEAAAIVEEAKAEGRAMVAEARAVRERMLSDLSRRRRAAEAEVIRLTEARDRLLEMYDVMRRTLDQTAGRLERVDPAPRLPGPDSGSTIIARSPTTRTAEPPKMASEHSRSRASTPRPLSAGVLARTDPARTDPARTDPARTDPARTDPARTDPARTDPAKPDPPGPTASVAAVGTVRISSRSSSAPHDGPQAIPGGSPRRSVAPHLRPQSVVDAVAVVRTEASPEPSTAVSQMKAALKVASPLSSGNTADTGPAEELVDEPDFVTPPPPPPPPVVPALFARLRSEQEPGRQLVAKIAGTGPTPDNDDQGIAVEMALTRRDDALEPIQAELTRILKRVLRDDQNELLDRLRQLGRVSAECLPDPLQQRARFAQASLEFLEQAWMAGIRFATGGDESAEASMGSGGATEVAAELARALVLPLTNRVAQAVGEGVSSPDSSSTTERVNAMYRHWKLNQIEPLGRHFAIVAFARGQFEATPQGALQRWLVDDETPSPDCDDDALGGLVAKGDAFPTGQFHPPSHVGCRCLLLPRS